MHMREVQVSSENDSIRRLINCECGQPLWVEVIDGSEIYIELGQPLDCDRMVLKCQHYSGSCNHCGRHLEWHCNQVRLERLIQKIVNRTKKEEY